MKLEVSEWSSKKSKNGIAEVSSFTLEENGFSEGRVFGLQGERNATVTVMGSESVDDGCIGVSDTIQECLGDVDIVEATPLSPAVGNDITVAPYSDFDIKGGEKQVRKEIKGCGVRVGDYVDVAGAGIEMRFVITDVDPAGAVVCSDETTISVRDTPATKAEKGITGSLPPVSYEDVSGRQDAVETVQALVSSPLSSPAMRDVVGTSPGGVVVTGMSGVGKSHLLHAVATETDAEIIPVVSPAQFDDVYNSEWSEVTRSAKQAENALVVIDNLALFAGSDDREAGLEIARVIDAVTEDATTGLIAACESLSAIPDVLRQGNRLTHEVNLEIPDEDQRKEMIQSIGGVETDDDVDFEEIAQNAYGFTPGDIERLIATAVGNTYRRISNSSTLSGSSLPASASISEQVTQADLEQALENVDPTALQERVQEVPDTEYSDIGGCSKAKKELKRAIEWPLNNADAFDAMNMTPPSGILLYGPPGTGKTMLARAVANATQANFMNVDGPELLNRYVGESEHEVRNLFDRARQHSPSIIFFDEIDAIAPERGDGGNQVMERVVSQLLTEVDGVQDSDEVMVIGATNRPDMIDAAFLRPGRLEKTVQVPVPDDSARAEIFKIHTDGLKITGVDPEELVTKSQGYTGSDIQAVVREASMNAMERFVRSADQQRPVVTGENFEDAFEEIDKTVTEEMSEYYENVEA